MIPNKTRWNDPPGEELGVLPYMGYIDICHCEGYGFQALYPGIWEIGSTANDPQKKKLMAGLKFLGQRVQYYHKNKFAKKVT